MKKQELLDFIKYQLKIELKELENFKSEKKIYVEIKKEDQFNVLSLLNEKNIEHNEHLNNKYWIYIEKESK